MTLANRGSGYASRPAPSGLADVIDIILDKGLVIDAYVRVSLVGIELLTIDARIVIASVDTYLRFAEATNRLDLYEKGGKDLPELFNSLQEGGAKSKTRGALGGVTSKVSEAIRGSGDDEDDEDDDSSSGSSSGSSRRRASSGASRSRRTRRSEDE
jgi:gas vesicle structural protein